MAGLQRPPPGGAGKAKGGPPPGGAGMAKPPPGGAGKGKLRAAGLAAIMGGLTRPPASPAAASAPTAAPSAEGAGASSSVDDGAADANGEEESGGEKAAEDKGAAGLVAFWSVAKSGKPPPAKAKGGGLSSLSAPKGPPKFRGPGEAAAASGEEVAVGKREIGRAHV